MLRYWFYFFVFDMDEISLTWHACIIDVTNFREHYNISFFKNLFRKKEKTESSKKPMNKILLKKERLIELFKILSGYADRIHKKWTTATTEEEKD